MRKKRNLDINTPKGEETRRQEREMYAYLRKILEVRFRGTSDDASRHDSYIYRGEKLVAVAESKCRNMTEAELERYGGTWLMTNAKVDACIKTAKKHGVPFVGLLYLIPEGIIYMLKITDKDGRKVIDYEVRESWTQTTVNNHNKIKRANAYFPLKTATRLSVDKEWLTKWRKQQNGGK